MFSRRNLTTMILALMVAGMAPPVSRAEVSAQTDAFGNYVRTTILGRTSVRQSRIWKVWRHGFGQHPLNPKGDLNGDLWPTLAENPVRNNHPLAVWSRSNGDDYDLAWSRWTRRGWTPIRWVHLGGPGDDLDPSVSFDRFGRAYAVWWRNEGGIGRVYVSVFLDTRWSRPLAVSSVGEDSRYPSIFRWADGVMRIAYRTRAGVEVYVLSFAGITTITDDLDPISQLSLDRVSRSRGR